MVVTLTTERIYEALEDVLDPEVPALSVVDLGIVRDVTLAGDTVRIDITPTYSGCPAMHVIETDIVSAVRRLGVDRVEVRTVFAPAWSTDWISASGRAKLQAYGIAPPDRHTDGPLVPLGPTIRREACPFCGSSNTELRSEFGPTACKSLYACAGCQQPFEYFKSL